METVQYFQFDTDSNMFVYAPGAGCTGEAKLVKIGEDLNVTASWSYDSGSDLSKFCR